MTTYRTKFMDPDYRRRPKTQRYCEVCQRDIKPGSVARFVAVELDNFETAIHPEDLDIARREIAAARPEYKHPGYLIQFSHIGPECAKKLGAEWTMAEIPATPVQEPTP